MKNPSPEQILQDSKELLEKVDLPDGYKQEMIFNLLAVKYEIRPAFSWSAGPLPDEGNWYDYDMAITDNQGNIKSKVYLKDLKKLVEDFGLAMDSLKLNGVKEFDYETLLNENPIPGSVDLSNPNPSIMPLGEITPALFEDIQNNFSPDYNDCEESCSNSQFPKFFFITTNEKMKELKENAKSMKFYERKEVCGFPKCCNLWFKQRDTEILADTLAEFYGTYGEKPEDLTNEAMLDNVIHNHWSHENYNHAKRMSKLNNRKDATNKKYPLLPFPVCDKCIDISDSDYHDSAAELNDNYRNFIQNFTPEIKEYFDKKNMIGYYDD
ncbi:MAG: hypothetical protein CL763_06905 [Chloroflexi bacterium]|nr:hypothetical protein [Chloroflexota bacterium]|tara:strand:+ start:3922 stop:4893 length:972 start_codon:yes stop_codon:yes gene_type:complete